MFRPCNNAMLGRFVALALAYLSGSHSASPRSRIVAPSAPALLRRERARLDKLGDGHGEKHMQNATRIRGSQESIVIGISGSSRSGKGWVSHGLLQALERIGKKATIVEQDDFWFQAVQVNVRGEIRTSKEEPECIDHGKFAAAIKEKTKTHDVVIAEGFQLVFDARVTSLLNHIYLIELEKDEASKRRTQALDGTVIPNPLSTRDFDDLLWPAYERYMRDNVAPLGERVAKLGSPTDQTERDELVRHIMHAVELGEDPHQFVHHGERLTLCGKGRGHRHDAGSNPLPLVKIIDESMCIAPADFNVGYGNCKTYAKEYGRNYMNCNTDKDAAGRVAQEVCPECGICRLPNMRRGRDHVVRDFTSNFESTAARNRSRSADRKKQRK